jgi:hypothetical protein
VKLTSKQIEVAIAYNQLHALDVLPAIERALGRAVPLPGQGQWNAEAVLHVATMQKRAELKQPDGQFGPGSRMALCDRLSAYPTAGLWPPPGSDERKHWAGICEIMGYPLTAERHTLVGLRGVSLDAAFTHPSASRPAYDDTFVWLDADGSVRRFAGATHSYQARSENMGDDIDGDGRSDIATIRPGRYLGKNPHYFHGKVALDVYVFDGSNNHIPTFRDVDGDRGISATDKATSEQPTQGAQVNEHGAYARGVKFHPGFDTKHAEGAFSSVGCQTAPLAEIQRLHAAKEFEYVLLDAVQILEYLGQLE